MATKGEIEYKIKSKMREWIESHNGMDNCKTTGTKMIAAIADHYILTGGAIVSLLLGEEPNDWDIYFDNRFVAEEVIEYYLKYLSNFSDEGHGYIITVKDAPSNTTFKWHNVSAPGSIEIDIDPNAPPNKNALRQVSQTSYYGNKVTVNPNYSDYAPMLVTNNAITLNNGIQVICRTVGNPFEIHRTFDFAHCVSYYTPKTGLVLNKFAMESILTKELHYIGSDYPIHSIFRMKKFVERGWTISQKEMLKILHDVSNLAFDKPTMKEQLFGGVNSPWNAFIDALDDGTYHSRNDFRKLLDEHK